MNGRPASHSGVLAWAGWRVRLPADWRALRISGTWARGSVIVGDAGEAILQIKWLRVRRRGFDAARWLRRRLRKVVGDPNKAETGPRAEGFPDSAWVPDRGKDKGAIWYGYAPAAAMIVEVVVAGTGAKKHRRTVAGRVLPSMQASAREAPTRWSVLGASFTSPPGFVLAAHRLQLGDLALLLRARGGARLVLRQVYPAKLALARRDLADWLKFPVFKEHRRFRPPNAASEWTVESPGVALDGARRTGRKRFPFPFGVFGARNSTAAVLHDRGLGRLLLAEYDSRGALHEGLLAETVRSMNWAQPAPAPRQGVASERNRKDRR